MSATDLANRLSQDATGNVHCANAFRRSVSTSGSGVTSVPPCRNTRGPGSESRASATPCRRRRCSGRRCPDRHSYLWIAVIGYHLLQTGTISLSTHLVSWMRVPLSGPIQSDGIIKLCGHPVICCHDMRTAFLCSELAARHSVSGSVPLRVFPFAPPIQQRLSRFNGVRVVERAVCHGARFPHTLAMIAALAGSCGATTIGGTET